MLSSFRPVKASIIALIFTLPAFGVALPHPSPSLFLPFYIFSSSRFFVGEFVPFGVMVMLLVVAERRSIHSRRL